MASLWVKTIPFGNTGIFNAGGSLLLSAACPECWECCWLCNCGVDLTTPTVGFGAATLTNDECDWCDQISGDFIMSPHATIACQWTYLDEDVCSLAAFAGTAACDLNFSMVLTIDACDVTLTVLLIRPGCTHDFNFYPAESISATYEGTIEAGCAFPITLTKTAEDFVPADFCGGEFPDTVTLDF